MADPLDPDGEQLSLFCGHCQGRGVVMNYATDANGECLVWPSPCPVCRPDPRHRDTLLAVVRLGRRLEP
jgi:hypothetical protein